MLGFPFQALTTLILGKPVILARAFKPEARTCSNVRQCPRHFLSSLEKKTCLKTRVRFIELLMAKKISRIGRRWRRCVQQRLSTTRRRSEGVDVVVVFVVVVVVAVVVVAVVVVVVVIIVIVVIVVVFIFEGVGVVIVVFVFVGVDVVVIIFVVVVVVVFFFFFLGDQALW